jgi:hypothetical protein
MAVEQLLSVEQLAAVLHKSPASIRSAASRNPSALPPICRLPGTKRLLWRQHDVDVWLARFASLGVQHAAAQAANAVGIAKRRGRPTKKEQITRDRLHAVSASTTTDAAVVYLPTSAQAQQAAALKLAKRA